MEALQKAVQYWSKNPKKLLLIDGFGALLSALTLGVVMPIWMPLFGIPELYLYVLAAFPCFFAVYDFYCYAKCNPAASLKGIAIMNLLYCFLSIGIALYHYKMLMPLGWAYIALELCIVAALAKVEYEVAKRI